MFDMDGVLRHWHPRTHDDVESDAGLPRGALLAAAFAVPEYSAGVRGEVSYDQWCEATEAALRATHGDSAARTAVQALRADRGRMDPEAVRLVEDVAARMPVILLSNAHDRLAEDLRHHGLADLFTAVVCSATERTVKPEPAIYRLAAERAGVEPGDCFFTDDLEENVVGARRVGMRASLFTGVPALRTELQSLGVLRPSPGPSPTTTDARGRTFGGPPHGRRPA